MIFHELSIAFFRFLVRALGLELEGGGGLENPPSGRGKSGGPSGCGLKKVKKNANGNTKRRRMTGSSKLLLVSKQVILTTKNKKAK